MQKQKKEKKPVKVQKVTFSEFIRSKFKQSESKVLQMFGKSKAKK